MDTLSKFFCIVLMMVISAISNAQPVVTDLEKFLAQIKTDPTAPFPPAILNDFKNEKALLNNLFRHRNDPGEQFQFRVLDLIRLIGLKSKNAEVRKSAVNHFVMSIPDKNLRLSGFASQAVGQFSKSDFSSIEKDSVVSYLKPGMPNLDLLFRLSGFLEIPSAKEKISSMLILPMSTILKWNARLALSRLGDENATNFILEKIVTSPIDDSFVYSLAPGLVYTREKRIFQQLEKIIQSDAYQCRSAHPDSKSTVLCAFRVVESVALTIEKFPLKVDDSGDLLVDNYKAALEAARKWLKQNPDYKINRNTM